MKLIKIVTRHSEFIGIVLIIGGFLLAPIIVGIPLLMIGFLLASFGFYRRWIMKLVPESTRQKVKEELIQAYQPHTTAMNSLKTLSWQVLKIALSVSIFASILIVSLGYFSLVNRKNDSNGFWLCSEEGNWIAQGAPDYPAPIKLCQQVIALPSDRESCVAQGGMWGKQGPDANESCNRKAVDRGNLCRDNAECEGWCQINQSLDEISTYSPKPSLSQQTHGQCSVWVMEFGCFEVMERGEIKTICAD